MYNEKTIQPLILAGGFGTRLRSVIDDRPKSMANINGNPFICYLFEFLIKFNLKNIIISSGYMSEIIENEIGDNYKSIKINYSKEESPLGTGGAVKLASNHHHQQYWLIMNGDSYSEYNLSSFFKFHLEKKADISILVKKVEDVSRYGSIKMNNENKILNFVEKGINNKVGYINLGVYIMNLPIIKEISNDSPTSLEYDFFPRMLKKKIYGYKMKGDFIDIGTPESYLFAKSFFENL